MFFGGAHKFSLIDYPGKISCVLFTAGCNFHCPYCHNAELVTPIRLDSLRIDEKTILDFLIRRRGLLEGVVISGGEPTIQKGLIPFCKKVMQLGYQLKLDTNGSRPRIIRQLIDLGLVDYIAMDIKSDPFRYAPLISKTIDPDRIIKSIQIIMQSDLSYEFRTTCVKPFVDIGTVERIARLIEGAAKFVLQQFQNVDVLAPESFYAGNTGYAEIELLHMQSIAKPWVLNCTLRKNLTQSDRIQQKPDKNRPGPIRLKNA